MILAVQNQSAVFVQLRIYAISNHIALIERHRRIGMQFTCNALANQIARVQLGSKMHELRALRLLEIELHRRNTVQRAPNVMHFTRRNPTHRNFRNQALQIANGL